MTVFHEQKPSDGIQFGACHGYDVQRRQIALTFGPASVLE